MSRTIDERVLEMRFDNKQFESNIADTMSTLDKFKQKLNLTGASKGLEDVSSAARRVDMSSLGSAVETVQAKFSALQVMGVTALSNLTNSAVNAGKRIASALTIDPVKTGFSEYETQINAVQTILANTSSKGTTLDDVNGALDTLNAYADKTIYNFTEMTRNIGTFTAAGVDLDTSVNAIQGIANLAAVSGSTSQQASTAMYQLSQAMASGTVKLMDWNSVVNAGMGGEVFQNALKETAKVHGIAIDEMIKRDGSFRETLSSGWLTTDILTETLEKFTMCAEEGTEEWEKYKKSLMEQGYTEEQAKEILKMGKTATEAATKVKTFTQLFDTLKEAAQSGWTQSWEIIVGDFEEAKATLTEISDILGKMINDSAKQRNDILQGWKDAGGREDLIQSLRNGFEGVMNVIKPIKEAFAEIFPSSTESKTKSLINFTTRLKEFTEKFKTFTSEHGDEIKATFKGIFSVIDIGVTAVKAVASGIGKLIKNFSGLGGGVLGATSSLGNWLTNLRDSIKETDIFGKGVEKVTGFIQSIIDKLKEFGSSAKKAFQSHEFEGFLGFFEGLWNVIKQIGSKVGSVFSSIGKGLSDVWGGTDLFDIINSFTTSGILVGIQTLVWKLSSLFGGGGLGSIKDGFLDIFDGVSDCLGALQQRVQSETLIKIATAIAILAGSLFVLSLINADKLDHALGIITMLFVDLMGAMAVFNKVSGGGKGVFKSCGAMIAMSVAVGILSLSMAALSKIDPEGIVKGLIAIGVLMAELLAFLNFAKFDGKSKKTAVGIVILSASMLILAKAVKNFGAMDWEEIRKGLAAIGALLLELGLFTKLTGNAKHVISTGLAMVLLGASMKIFASAVKDFAGMSWDEIGRGLGAMAGALAEVTIAMRFMPKGTLGIGVGLVAVAGAMAIMANVLKSFGGMSWDEIGRGLGAMAGALLALTIALNFMNGTLAGSAALIIAAGALAIIAPVMKTLGGMSWDEIIRGLVTLAGAFVVIGVAGALLTPIIPSILGLAASLALFGVATLGIGAGLVLIAAGITALSGSVGIFGTTLAALATAIVAGLSVIIIGVAGLIPSVIRILGEAIVAFCDVIAECAPKIAETVLIVITEVLAALAEYTPEIVTHLFDFLIGVLDAFAEKLPDLIVAAVNLIGAFFVGIVEALRGIDTSTLVQGIIGAGLLAGLMVALSAVVSLIPGAMAGVLGMGLVVAEMALVLAAIGALAQIPGLHWLIEEGGDLLQSIGTAIGQFIGGIVGGVMGGVTAQLPQIGTDLSDFMTNVQPFIEGAKAIDPAMLTGVRALAETVLILTAANILEGLTSWITGGSSLSSFGAELADLGTNLSAFAENLGSFDDSKVTTITCAANAVKALAQAADTLPNEGGWAAKIFGENSISAFGAQLPGFAKNLNGFATNLGTFDEAKLNTITCAANAVKALADAASALPNEGGWAAKIFGENSISTFGSKLPGLGTNLGKFATNLGTFDDAKVATVECAASAIKAMATASQSIDGQADWAKKIFGDNSLSAFGEEMASLGTNLKSFASNLGTFDEAKVTTVKYAVKAIEALAALAGTNLKDAKKNLGGFGEEMVDFAEDVSSFCDNMPSGDSVTSAVSNTKKIASMIKEVADADAAKFADFANSLEDIGTEGVDAFVSAFTSSSAKTDVKKAAVDLVKKIIEGVNSEKKSLKTAFGDAVKSGIGAVEDYYSDFKDAGSYLVDGFCAGISANDYKAEAKAKAMAKAAAKAAEEALDINSPSKVFKAIGSSVPEGFALGIDRIREVVMSSRSMADTAVTSVKDSISRIVDVINSDMDTQPTISPVLDLSNVESGAGAISGLFGNGASVGVLANVGSISSMMNDRSQNGVGDIVSAIDRLRREGNSNSGNTYQINGITYDDGTNVANAIGDLVRALKIGGRA